MPLPNPHADLGFIPAAAATANPHADLGFVPSGTAAPGAGPSATEAALRGGAQGATLGFADEAEGGVQALLRKYVQGSAADAQRPLGDLYREGRDVARRENSEAAQAHPTAYTAGAVAGGVPLAVGLGGGGPLATAAKAAALGAESGLGGSDADLTRGDVAGAVKDTAIGAGASLLSAGAGAAAPRLANAAAGAAKEVAALPLGQILRPGATDGTAALTALVTGHPGAAAAVLVGGAGKRALSTAMAISLPQKIAAMAMKSPGKLGVYGPVLAEALQRGGQDAFNANYYVLGQTDPKFQEKLAELAEDHTP